MGSMVSNALHGRAYGYGRNNNFDAYDPYLRGPLFVPKQTDDFKQFGGSLGGPIMRPGTLIGAPFHEWDLSLSKMWKIRERLNLQASVSSFNFLNSTNYALNPPLNQSVNVPSVFGQSSQDPNNGNPVNGTGGPREVQLGLKLTFLMVDRKCVTLCRHTLS